MTKRERDRRRREKTKAQKARYRENVIADAVKRLDGGVLLEIKETWFSGYPAPSTEPTRP